MNKNNEKKGIEGYNKVLNGKSIIISGDIHNEMKTFCKTEGIKMAYLVEKLFLDYKENFLTDGINKEKKQ